MKILLIDDDAFLIDMYAAKFSSTGHDVDTAKTVELALEKLRAKHEYDAILLDMVLPGMTGTELLAIIQAEKLAGKSKIIILSNQGDQGDINGAKSAGADDYIIKAHMIPSEVVQSVVATVAGK